jgi:hypothetical protein
MIRFSELEDFRLILVGDRKSPTRYDFDIEYLDISKQDELFSDLSRSLPFDHYTRKNIGYAFAIREGYSIIAESDDDNIPYDTWCKDIVEEEHDDTIVTPGMTNIYSFFTEKKIWPRGYPLDLINTKKETKIEKRKLKIGVWQGLVDKEADVDAVYRLVIGDEISFDKGKKFALDRGVISPFNSQNTIWNTNSFPYLYLPCTVSFRYTDILRSYVAQFGLWARGLHVGFMSPSCYQERNPHSLMVDFKDEVTMYLKTNNVIESLESCSGSLTGSDEDLIIMYEALSKIGVVENEEIIIAEKWINAIKYKRKQTDCTNQSLTA